MHRLLSFFLGVSAFAFIASTGVAQDLAALRQEITAAPNSAPAILAESLRSAGPGASVLCGRATAAAIESLGPDATTKKITALVYAAVRVVPDSAITIVRAAVNIDPQAAPEIAAAAVRAVPNPWKEVRYQRGEPVPPMTSPAGTEPVSSVPLANTGASPRETDFKSTVDSAFQDAVNAILDPAAPGVPMSLAEAIVQAASDPGGNYAGVQSAVDAALFGHPGALFYAVISPLGLSGVGDAGNSNYANEPHLLSQTPNSSGASSRSQQNPPSQPSPPSVSP